MVDWKVPITILILVLIVSLGIFPFFSSDFASSLTDVLSPVNELFNRLFDRNQEFQENILLSFSTKELNNLQVGAPSDLSMKFYGAYKLKVDGKDLTVDGELLLKNFTGSISFTNSLISGSITGLSSGNFKLEGNSKVQLYDMNMDELRVAHLKIGELTVNSGEMKVTYPQNLEVKLDLGSKIYGFQGDMIYSNNEMIFNGKCSNVHMDSFTLG
ncbi:MAG: hypothetical protein DRP06_01165 [Candidatus Aenigmatarchaeota archaeon]|nr:MAG: hypothetical protein DRP06_01165 [Candidatus Aenigmarchaeota archaeon]